jgi:hypothetical protein
LSRGIEDKTTIIVVKGKENRREIVKTTALLLRALKLMTIATGNKVTTKRGNANPIAPKKATAPKRVPATTATRTGQYVTIEVIRDLEDIFHL